MNVPPWADRAVSSRSFLHLLHVCVILMVIIMLPHVSNDQKECQKNQTQVHIRQNRMPEIVHTPSGMIATLSTFTLA